jgi:hypothetical protein
MIKKLTIFFAFLFICSSAQAWIFKRHKDHGDHKEKGDTDNGININLGSMLGGGSRDGAGDRKNAAGNKADNQGYAEYKRWAIGIMLSVYAVPYQDGDKYVGMEGISGFLEHNISEFFTIGVVSIDQKFSHLDSNYSDDQIHHKHVAGYAGLRKWITNRSVASARFGIADSKVSYLGETIRGTTEYLSVGLEYALADDDSSRIGYRYNSISGKDKAGVHNIGMSLHAMTFQVLF